MMVAMASASALCTVLSFVDVKLRCQVIANVCTRWRKYCRHHSLWQRLDFELAAFGLRHAAKTLLRKHADHVESIDLGRVALADTLVRYLCRCTKVKQLTIRSGLINARLAKLSAGSFASLESFSFTGPRLSSSGQSHQVFHNVVESY